MDRGYLHISHFVSYHDSTDSLTPSTCTCTCIYIQSVHVHGSFKKISQMHENPSINVVLPLLMLNKWGYPLKSV